MTLQKRKLIIGAKRGKWRSNTGIESADLVFQQIRPKVLTRDEETCVYCGISLPRMHVHHVNDDHEDNRMDNLVTVDDLCHAVHHVGLLGDEGVIVYMPGLSQVDLVQLCRTIAVAISFGGEIGDKAKRLYDFLATRFSEPIREVFGSSSPADFGNALLALSDEHYAARDVPLRDVRVLFKPEALSEYAARARRAAYENLPPSSWQRVYEDFLSQEAKTGDREKT